MDDKEKLNNEIKKYAGGGFADTDNHIPKSVRENYFGNGEKNKKRIDGKKNQL
ncbi:hypothetical protein [Virgibacillus sp. DJP39]|uniref:hypothetical protein n=1 Tax=Virgibacillus sp. DJP39 TaxID=3409790 RepID=UPI003BB783C5